MKALMLGFFRRCWRAATASRETDTATSALIRFADYELDVSRHELRRNGQRIPLVGHAFDLLMLLVLKQGLLVTREESVRALWKDHPPSNIDASINNLIRQIRDMLGDDPARPQFVENVRGKGYRFIAPVVFVRNRKEWPPFWWLATAGLVMATLTLAILNASYGTVIVSLCGGAVLLLIGCPRWPDTATTRLGASAYFIPAMAYIPSGWTLASLMPEVVNMETLRPAVLYPVITGLKFVPAFVLIFATWTVLAVDGDVGFSRGPFFVGLMSCSEFCFCR